MKDALVFIMFVVMIAAVLMTGFVLGRLTAPEQPRGKDGRFQRKLGRLETTTLTKCEGEPPVAEVRQ